MKDIIDQALAIWSIHAIDITFIAGRENQVYHIKTIDQCYALRIRRPGYKTDEELKSELDFMNALSRAGLSVPKSYCPVTGQMPTIIQDHRVDLIHWLPGHPLGKSHVPLQLDHISQTFYRLGQEMARLHMAADDWVKPDDFQRWHWNQDGLLGETPLWGRFWDNPFLNLTTKNRLLEFRKSAISSLKTIFPALDYGLIHADLVRENIMLDGQTITMIDFDDSGWGYRLFDVATTLLKNKTDPAYTDIESALITGYQAERALDTTYLDLFMALRSVTYVGWIMDKMHEDGSPERLKRFIEDALHLSDIYLSKL